MRLIERWIQMRLIVYRWWFRSTIFSWSRRFAPMSVEQSGKTLSFVKPRSFADPRAARIAKPSMMRGEETYSWAKEPLIGLGMEVPEKFQDNPAKFRALSYAASVLHVVDLSQREVFVLLLIRSMTLPSKIFFYSLLGLGSIPGLNEVPLMQFPRDRFV